MSYADVRRMIERERQPSHCFIKWWGDDEALVDYELLDRFLAKERGADDVVGFELLSLDEMWQVFIDLNPDQLSRERTGGREEIRWVWKDRQGREQVSTFPFTPNGLMELMESEFFD